MSRMRGRIDVALMMLTRDWIARVLVETQISLRMQVDASPQGGRDYAMIVCNIATHRDQLALHGWISELEGMRNLSRANRLRLFDREAELMSNIAAKIHWHARPLVALGQGRGSLPLKFRAVLHSLGLMLKDRATLSALVRSTVSGHSE